MKKILLVLCFLIGFQMQANAVIVDPYLAPVPNYYTGSAIDFSINVGTPYYPYYCDPYYPYYCRRPYYSTGVYVSPYWNIGFGWGWGRPYHHHHHHPTYRPHHRSHIAPHPAPHRSVAPAPHRSTHASSPGGHRPSGGGHRSGGHHSGGHHGGRR